MMNLRTMILSFIVSAATAAVICFLLTRKDRGIAVIDAVKLANEYTMKKEMEEMAKVKLLAISKQVDSVAQLVQIARTARDNEHLKQLLYTADYFKAKLEESYTQSNNEINAQIWKRLNPMLNELGKSKGLHLIIGANGMGSVLYTDGHYDITEEAISFINKKYAEGN